MVKIKRILLVIAFVAAIGFGIGGFCVPPPGIIDSSVLWLIAQFLLFCCSVLGIDLRTPNCVSTSKSVSITNDLTTKK